MSGVFKFVGLGLKVSLLVVSVSACGEPTEQPATVQEPSDVSETNPTSSGSICPGDEQLTTYCGFQNPEDLALLPGGKHLIATGFGGLPPAAPGTLYVIDVNDGARYEPTIKLAENTWGDPQCVRKTTEISPHGLSLVEREDEALALAITNHLPRETIEFFELNQKDGLWSLTWRGCVDAMENKLFNDVAMSTDGSFYATSMYDADLPIEGLFEAGFSVDDTGDIWHWNKPSGYDMLAGTSGSFPNGIAISANGEALFINYWFAGKTVKYDLATNSVVATHRSGLTDNLTVVGNAVWVGTHDITLADLEKCPPEVAQCTLPFTIHVLSEGDLIPLQSYQFDSEVFGAATVAIPVGEFIWLGTFHGDRVARHKLN